jgi:hypothetical protein
MLVKVHCVFPRLAARESRVKQGSTYLEAESSLTAEPFYSSNGYIGRERGEHVLRNGQRMARIKMRKTIALRTNSNDRSGVDLTNSTRPRAMAAICAFRPKTRVASGRTPAIWSPIHRA